LLTIVVASSHVDGASLIGNFISGHPLESSESITTVATEIGELARDENLRGDVNIGPGSLAHDLYSIRHGRGCGMSPAGTTVLRNVLVSHVGQVVHTVDIVPDVLLRKLNSLERSRYLRDDRGGRSSVARSLGVNEFEVFLGSDGTNKECDSDVFHK
jgi:hypothetical protein